MQDILWPPRERRLYRHLLRTPGTGAPLISLIVRRLIAALRHRGPDCLRGAAFVFHARLSVPRRAYYSRKVRSLRAAACSRGQLHNKGETPRSSPRILRTLLAGQPPARRVESSEERSSLTGTRHAVSLAPLQRLMLAIKEPTSAHPG